MKILKEDFSEMECQFENLYESENAKCPKGWAGKAEEGNCYKVHTIPETNNNAAQVCYQDGAELLQIESQVCIDFALEKYSPIRALLPWMHSAGVNISENSCHNGWERFWNLVLIVKTFCLCEAISKQNE